jgi:hypothetical protein
MDSARIQRPEIREQRELDARMLSPKETGMPPGGHAEGRITQENYCKLRRVILGEGDEKHLKYFFAEPEPKRKKL